MSFNLEGHRGCRGLMPENTIPAMLKAIELGVTTLEMDVVITKDRQVILSHDTFFHTDITTKPDGTFVNKGEQRQLNIYQMNYDEVVRYDVGLKPHPKFTKQQKIAAVKPRLKEVIDTVEIYCKHQNLPLKSYKIEIKSKPSTDNIYHPAPNEFVDLLMAVIIENKIEERVIVQSFDIRTLQFLRLAYPQIKIALLVENKRSFETNLNALGFTPEIYSPYYLFVNKELVAKCKAKGVQIIPWTVNSVRAATRLRAIGVDAIITDYPDLKY